MFGYIISIFQTVVGAYATIRFILFSLRIKLPKDRFDSSGNKTHTTSIPQKKDHEESKFFIFHQLLQVQISWPKKKPRKKKTKKKKQTALGFPNSAFRGGPSTPETSWKLLEFPCLKPPVWDARDQTPRFFFQGPHGWNHSYLIIFVKGLLCVFWDVLKIPEKNTPEWWFI